MNANAPSTLDRYRGALLGLATGDALGTAVEYRWPGKFTPVDDMVAGGSFSKPPGVWTNDTSMALCLATSLLECGGFDAADQMHRYIRFWREGYLTATGRSFHVVDTIMYALLSFERNGNPIAGTHLPYEAGNGSLVRLAPVPLFFAADHREAILRSEESSRTTHQVETTVDGCRYLGGLIASAVHGVDKETLLSAGYCPIDGMWAEAPLAPNIEKIAQGSFKVRQPPELRATAWVVDTLESALWAFHGTSNFREGALKAINLGDDSSSTGAVFGQLAGAHYGVDAIPAEWRAKVAMADEILALADALYEHAKSGLPA